ncbi:MAG TPA: hypothetical protein VK195_02880 [Burkholderiaceae bacterium]|nr:hypothetical protein [Burkholderiaceae bacterium]
MNSGNKAPKPPDPNVTAAAQTGSNQSTAMFEQMLNMQDQRTPYGSLTWQPSGTWSYKDPTSGKTVTVPKFMASQVLSPTQQGLLDQTQQFDARYNQMALDQAAQIKEKLSTPFQYNPGVHEQWAGGLYDKLNSQSIARGQDDLQQQLANRGVNIGTEAYTRGMQDFYEGNQRARDAFMLDSYGTGMNTALTERNQPLKEGQALMGAAQITEPAWLQGPQSGVANTDVAGITNSAYSQQMARAQQAQQQSAGMWGALGQIGGAALGGWMSDKRAKKDVSGAGRDPESGLPVKNWTYKGDTARHQTPMAQDVEKKYPQAVSEDGSGLKRVNWHQVPGGEKFVQDMARKPMPEDRFYGGSGRPMDDLPTPNRLKGFDMQPDGENPMENIRKALPPEKYQDASLKRRGLQRLGQRRAV